MPEPKRKRPVLKFQAAARSRSVRKVPVALVPDLLVHLCGVQAAPFFAAKPQDWTQKVNRKMYRVAMRSILSQLVREDRLLVVGDFKLENHKTKTLVAKLKELDLKNVLIVNGEFDSDLFLASRNLYKVEVCQPGTAEFNPINLINFDKVVMTEAAVKKVEEMLK